MPQVCISLTCLHFANHDTLRQEIKLTDSVETVLHIHLNVYSTHVEEDMHVGIIFASRRKNSLL